MWMLDAGFAGRSYFWTGLDTDASLARPVSSSEVLHLGEGRLGGVTCVTRRPFDF